MFSFPLRLFVCLFPWFWLLSFLRRYVHLLFPNASPSLSSQVLLVVCHAFVLFLIFYYIHTGFFFLSVDCFYILSLHWLIWTPDVCHWVSGLSTLFYLCRAVAGCICHPVGLTRVADALWLLCSAVWPLFLCMLWWSLSLIWFLSCIIPFPVQWAQQKKCACLLKLIMCHFTQQEIVVCSLVSWKGNTAPFYECSSALFLSCYKWISRVTVQTGVVLDQTGPNCGRETWTGGCAERDSGIVQVRIWSAHS